MGLQPQTYMPAGRAVCPLPYKSMAHSLLRAMAHTEKGNQQQREPDRQRLKQGNGANAGHRHASLHSNTPFGAKSCRQMKAGRQAAHVRQGAALSLDEGSLLLSSLKALHAYLCLSQGERAIAGSPVLASIVQKLLARQAVLFSAAQQKELSKLVASCKVGRGPRMLCCTLLQHLTLVLAAAAAASGCNRTRQALSARQAQCRARRACLIS